MTALGSVWSRRIRTGLGGLAGAVLCSAILTAPAGADDLTLDGQWQVQSSAIVTAPGDQVSRSEFSSSDWLPVRTNDAGAVGGEVAAQIQNIPAGDRCGSDNIFYSNNLDVCQGIAPDAHSAPNAPYDVPWWFRTTFKPNLHTGQHALLRVRGIMGQADVWVNGTQVATRDEVQGSEPEYEFDVTSLLTNGRNTVAFRLHPNNPDTMLTQDFNDWTQTARDQNTGIKYPVKLHVSDALRLSDMHVVQDNAADMSHSDLTVKGTVANVTDEPQSGDVSATVSDPRGRGVATVRRTVDLGPNETRTVQFDPTTDPGLGIDDPALWWPYQMGDQPLYHLSMRVSQHGRSASDSDAETFGIRTVESRLSAPGTSAYNGSRWIEINGKPFVFRGGGMMDQDMFLRYSHERLDNQIRLIKQMGLNGMRLEGDDQPDDFYQRMDEEGLLVYGGFLCCDYWEAADDWTEKDQETNYRTALALGRQQRNHPSVVFYSWSDEVPSVLQEAGVLRGFQETDFDIPVMASAEYKSTAASGPSGMKEGPYNWFPPSYAYSRNCRGSSGNLPCTSGAFVNRGGAWAFQTESSPGSTVPTQDSLDRFMTPAEQKQMITSPNLRLFHSGRGDRDNGTSYGSFPHIGVLATAICHRYGTWTDGPVTCPTNPPGTSGQYSDNPSISDFVRKAHAINYETVRAQFEAYIDRSTRLDSPSTGLVYWMMNKPMPSLLWYFYNYDYDQAGTYFGAKKANESLHVYYAYAAPEEDPGNRTINVSNLTGETQSGLSVTARAYDMQGNVLSSQNASGITLPSQGVMNRILSMPNPTLADVGGVPQRTYFVELLLKRGARVVDRNVYWLSTVNDVPTYTGNAYPNLSAYGDLRNLQTPEQDPANGLLPKTTVDACAATRRVSGKENATDVTLTNNSGTVAFLLRVDVRRGKGSKLDAGDNQVRPATYSDNYVTLWPGQSQTITETHDASLLRGKDAVVTVDGFNVDTAVAGSGKHCGGAGSGVEDFGRADGAVGSGQATPGKANSNEVMTEFARRVQVGR
jgi:exo-1,4-beta-D-glucosaminidase